MSDIAIAPPANNAVKLLSNDVILIVRTGRQMPESMDRLRAQTEKCIKKLRREHKKVFIMVDDSRVTGYDERVRAKILDFMHTVDYDAVAVYGLSAVYRVLTEGLVAMGHQKDRVRTFGTAHDAAAWLAGRVVNARG